MMEQFEAAAREQEDIFERNQREYNRQAQLNGEVTMQRDSIKEIQVTAKYCCFELTQTEIIRFSIYRAMPELDKLNDVQMLYEILDDEEKKKAIHDHYMWNMRFKDGKS